MDFSLSCLQQLHRLRGGSLLFLLSGDDDTIWIAVHRGAGPEAAAWAGQEAAVVLEDMTRSARRLRTA